MAFCPNCGREVSGDASFCPACGATVAASGGGMPPSRAPDPPASAPPPQPPAPPMGVQAPYSQPPAGAPPAYGPGTLPPPPAGKKKSGWKIAIIVLLAVILVAAVVGTLLAVFVFSTVKAPVDVTNQYIEAINEGDAARAWELLHPDSPFKESYTLSSFESDVVEPNERLRTWNANQVEVRDSRATVGVDMESGSGEEFRIEFDLRKDGGDWRIYDYYYAD